MQPMVSIVVPCYNKEHYIGAFLSSLYQQRWDNIQIICVNDGSQDRTRAVIAEWEPALRERFTLIILDQPNQGVALAVKNGLAHVTGDYVCMVDCDDELYPDYVSAMAEYLENHPLYDGCICDFDFYLDSQARLICAKDHNDNGIDIAHLTIEDFILGSYCRAIWRFFIRTPFFERCGIRAHIPQTNQRITHEAYVAIPLLVNGTFGHVTKSLYKFRIGIPSITNTKGLDEKIYYEDVYLEAIRQVMDWINMPEDRKARVLSMAQLTRDYEVTQKGMLCAENDDERRHFVQAMGASVNRFFSAYGRSIAIEKLDTFFVEQSLSISLLWLAILQAIKPDHRLRHDMERLKNKRIIGYGAKGRAAAWRIPLLMATALNPSVLWDNAAVEGDQLCGIPITKPALASLTETDAVFVFPKNPEVLSAIRENLRGKNIAVFCNHELARLTAVLCFPEIR